MMKQVIHGAKGILRDSWYYGEKETGNGRGMIKQVTHGAKGIQRDSWYYGQKDVRKEKVIRGRF